MIFHLENWFQIYFILSNIFVVVDKRLIVPYTLVLMIPCKIFSLIIANLLCEKNKKTNIYLSKYSSAKWTNKTDKMKSWKLVLLKGVFCSMVCNVIFIISNKIIIKYSLSGNNINFFKGLLQTILSLLILSIKNICRKEDASNGNNEHLEEQENMMCGND